MRNNKCGRCRSSYTNIDIVFFFYIIKCSIEIGTNILVVIIHIIDFVEFTYRLFVCILPSSHPDTPLFIVMSTAEGLFFHLDLVSYEDQLRNTKSKKR